MAIIKYSCGLKYKMVRKYNINFIRFSLKWIIRLIIYFEIINSLHIRFTNSGFEFITKNASLCTHCIYCSLKRYHWKFFIKTCY